MTNSRGAIFPFQPAKSSPLGFTLLELIISMTVISMVVVVVYSAFSMGVRVWERQELDNEGVRREEVLLRLLDRDFADIVPYNTHWQAAPLSLFVGASQTLFYVTRNGFASQRRDGRALFFGCFFVARDEQGGMGLYLYKVPEPSPDLLAEIRRFTGMSQGMRGSFVLPDQFRNDAVLIVDGLTEASFSFAAEPFTLFAGSPEEELGGIRWDEDALELEDWAEEAPPGRVLLRYQPEGREPRHVLLVPGVGKI